MLLIGDIWGFASYRYALLQVRIWEHPPVCLWVRVRQATRRRLINRQSRKHVSNGPIMKIGGLKRDS
jgi:hypothetical protein